MSTTKKVTLQSILSPTMMYLTIDSKTGNLVFASKPFVWDCTVYQVDELTDTTTAVISYTNEKGKVLSLQPDYEHPLGIASYPAIVVEDKSQTMLKLTHQQNNDLDSIFSINAAGYEGDVNFFSLKYHDNDMTKVVFNRGENSWNIVDV